MTFRWKIAQALEIRWWRRYLKHKEEKSYLVAKQAYWQRILQALAIDIQPAMRVLDAGCGPAGIFMILNKSIVDAVDPLVEEYEQNLSHFKKADYPNVQFYSQAFEYFEIKQSYNIVFCMNAINHVADLGLCVNKLVAATATDGQLILAVDVHKYQVLKNVFRAIPGDLLHPHQHGLEDYIKMLELQGCKIVKTIIVKTGRIFDYVAIIVTAALVAEKQT